jgi:hypothetical protein
MLQLPLVETPRQPREVEEEGERAAAAEDRDSGRVWPRAIESLADYSRPTTTILRTEVFKETLRTSNQDSRSRRASHEHLARRSLNHRNRMRPTSPQGRTRTSTTATTNAPSAPRMSRGTHGVCGPAGHAGPSSTSAASKSGPPTRARQLPVNRLKMERRRLRDNGVVPGAIFPRTFCPRTSTVGARRSSTRNRCQGCHPFPVVKLALDRECSQRAALIRAQSLAMRALVLLAA